MPGRKYNSNSYRYGFNGKENDNEVKGEGNQQDYGMRIYDPRLGKFLSVDPLTADYPWFTPYQFAGNMPIWAIDIDGMEGDKKPNANESKTESEEDKSKAGAMKSLAGKLDENLAGGKAQNENRKAFLRSALKVKAQEIQNLKELKKQAFEDFLNLDDKFGAEGKAKMSALDEYDAQINSKQQQFTFLATQLYKAVSDGKNIETYNKWLEAELSTIQYGVSVMTTTASFLPSGGSSAGFFLSRPAAGRVFWSGGKSAGTEAALFAGQRGMVTLEMTTKGRLLTGLTNLTSYKFTRPLWEMASRSFARGAKGEAHVFLNFNRLRTGSTWLKFEKPILQRRGINIITHPVIK